MLNIKKNQYAYICAYGISSKAKKNENLRINILALMDIRISLQCDLRLSIFF